MKPYYEHAGITIYHGDCREILPQLPPCDSVLTDPPYGIASIWQGGGGHGWSSARSKSPLRNSWDEVAPDLTFLLSDDRPTIIWGGNHFNLPPSRSWLVWRKEVNPVLTLGDAELAWTNLDKPIRVFDHPRSKLTGGLVPEHPTTKPLPLMLWCLSLLKDANTVLDPFLGSGTSLVAAKKLGRSAIGIETEEKYCEIAAKRLSQEVFDFSEAKS
jgi:site-specific DNA-methyltransferase (adenine-specific)